ncbi:MAG: hypothetical protein AAB413_01365 [Patescibacteria group bacterium]
MSFFKKTITTDDIADGLINIGITSLTEAGIIGYGQLFADLDIGEQLKEGTKKEITILEAFVVTQAVQQKVDSKDLSKRILDKVHEKLYRRMNLSETEATEFEKLLRERYERFRGIYQMMYITENSMGTLLLGGDLIENIFPKSDVSANPKFVMAMLELFDGHREVLSDFLGLVKSKYQVT